MYDTALDEFLDRFGDKTKTDRPKVESVGGSKLSADNNLKLSTDNGLTPIKADTSGLIGGPVKSGQDLYKEAKALRAKETMGKITAGVGTAAEAAPQAMGLLSNINGGQFDTSAEGGGVGNARGAILQGASQGAQLGQVAGPWGMAAGAAIGGGISALGHTKAKKEYYDNRKKFNLKADALEKAEMKETYAISEGLASLENMKVLRQKQLGLS